MNGPGGCLTKANSTAIFVVPKQIIQGNTVVESIRNLLTLILDGPEGV